MRKRKCRSCKEYFRPEEGAAPYIKWCSGECRENLALKALQKTREATERAFKRKRKNDLKVERKAHRARKDDLKTINHWLKLTQRTAFNPYILLRDKNEPCHSCGDWDAIEYHAGHYRTIGAASQLRFNEDNCFKQCQKCNTHMSGNVERYRVTLVNKIGLDRVEALENNNETKRWTREELEEIRITYRAKIKEIKNEQELSVNR